MKKFIIIFFCCITLLVAASCSSKYTTVGSNEDTTIYQLDENEAFKIAHLTLLNLFPGRKITVIDGPVRGYSTTFRFVLDTYSQQVLIINSSGKNANGKRVNGYYYEVSGSGSSGQGYAKNKELFNTINHKLALSNTGVHVTSLKTEGYQNKQMYGAQSYQPNSVRTNTEVFDDLERLNELYENGVLTESEYKEKKAELLEEL